MREVYWEFVQLLEMHESRRPATTLLSIASGQTQQSSQLCSNQVCISATIFSKNPNTIEFSLFSRIQVGWLGVGLGGISNGMSGNDLALCWPNANGTGAVISQRSATKNGAPSPLASVAFKVQQPKSGITSSTKDFTCTFSRPLNLSTSPIAATATSVNVIYAVGLKPVKDAANGNPQQAMIQQHTYTGHGTLMIQRKEGSSSDTNNTVTAPPPTQGSSGNSTSDDSGSDQALAAEILYDKLVKAHGILMSLAFLILFPTGAIIVRFFSHLHHVFRWHRPIQVTGFLFVIGGIACIITAVYQSPDGPPAITETTHALLGVIIFTALVLQISFGIYIFHAYNPTADAQKPIHRVFTWVHRGWGYTVLILGFIQVKLGLVLYGMWPEGTEAIWDVYYIWVILLAMVIVVGSIVKSLKQRNVKLQDESHNHPAEYSKNEQQQEQQQHFQNQYQNDNNINNDARRHQGQYELRQSPPGPTIAQTRSTRTGSATGTRLQHRMY
ncbi:S-methyl-5-thioribose-1-phosphate isomerase [Haplosporangium sp. Z 27]|nr:S-methyl-5-thioribose-1-phosphate isomerase [Haplosporangium sp. Z 27]